MAKLAFLGMGCDGRAYGRAISPRQGMRLLFLIAAKPNQRHGQTAMVVRWQIALRKLQMEQIWFLPALEMIMMCAVLPRQMRGHFKQ